MGTLLVACMMLLVYALVAAYGYRDVFLARREREDIEEPILALWHLVISVALLLTAGALVVGGLLVAYSGLYDVREGSSYFTVMAKVVFGVLGGVASVVLGLAIVHFTRRWLAPRIGAPQAVSEIKARTRRYGGRHHAR